MITARPAVARRLKTIGRWLIVIYFALALCAAIGGRQGLLESIYFG